MSQGITLGILGSLSHLNLSNSYLSKSRLPPVVWP